MRRFLLSCALFIGALALTAWIADAFVTANLKKSRQGELGAWNDVFSGRVKAEVVIYGSSRAANQFDPAVIAGALGMSTYNLGVIAHNFRFQYLRHLELLKHGGKPRLIVQAVDSSTFMRREGPPFNPGQLLPYLRDDADVERLASSDLPYDAWDYHVPALRYYGRSADVWRAVMLSLGTPMASDRLAGFRAIPGPWDGDWRKAESTLRQLAPVPDAGAIALFDRFLRECREAGIRVVFVFPPEYVEARRIVPFREEMAALARKFAARDAIPVLDYSESDIGDRPEYFADALHLNAKGAEAFTVRLSKDLRELLAR